MITFERVIPHLLIDEGGYVNDPADNGGETKYGISKRAYPRLNIKTLTKKDAEAIYKKDYWDVVRADELPQWLRYTVFDMAVNAGVTRATLLLQELAGVKQDGRLGEITLGAADKVSLSEYSKAREAYYEGLAKRVPRNRKFLKGWLKRVARVHNTTLQLLA